MHSDYIREESYSPADGTGISCPSGSNSISVNLSISVSGINCGFIKWICIGENWKEGSSYSLSHSITTTITVPLGNTDTRFYWSALVVYYKPTPSGYQRCEWTYRHWFTVYSGIEPDCATPTITISSAPQNGQINVPLRFTMNWGTTNCTNSKLWYKRSTDSSYTNWSYPNNAINYSCNTTYQWYITQENEGANCTKTVQQTSVRTFTTIACPLPDCTTPVLISVNGPTGTNVGLNPSFTWSFLNATECKFGLGPNPSKMIEITVGTSSELHTSSATNFAYSTTYYWYVKQINQNQGVCNTKETSSDIRSFTTIAKSLDPCVTPTMNESIFAPNNQSGIQLNPTLTWNVQNFTKCVLHYKKSSVSVWTQIEKQTATSHQLTNLEYNTTYEWKIYQENQTSGVCTITTYTSQVKTFTTKGMDYCITPSFTSVSGPTGQNTSLNPTFTWQANNVSTYEFWYKANSTGIWSHVSKGTQTSHQWSGLSYSTSYNWYVKQIHYQQGVCNQVETVTSTYTFTTIAQPVCPTPDINLISPVQNYTSQTNSVTLNWSSSTQNSYILYYKKSTNSAYIEEQLTSTSKSLNNLEYDTTYNWKVRQIKQGTSSCTQSTNDSQVRNFNIGLNSATSNYSVLSSTSLLKYNVLSFENGINFIVYCKYPEISDVLTTVIDHTTIKVDFTLQNTTSYKVKQKIDGEESYTLTWVQNGVGSGQKTHTTTGLSSESTYIWTVEQTNVESYCAQNVITFEQGDDNIGITPIDPESYCPLPIISQIEVTNISHDSFTIEFNLSGQTSFEVFYKAKSDGSWISRVTGTTNGDKTYIISGLSQNTEYVFKITQGNTGNGICEPSEFSTDENDSITNIKTLDCVVITRKPIITYPLSTTKIYQNSKVLIKWEQTNGSNRKYNVYVDNVNVTNGVLEETEFEHIFTQVKDYTIQVGQYNDCTPENTNTLSNILNISSSNIIPCTPLYGNLAFINPTEESIIILKYPYTINWTIPNGTDIKYNFYINDTKINSAPLTTNYIDYTFNVAQRYQLKVEQFNPCTYMNYVQTMVLDFDNFTEDVLTELKIYSTYSEQIEEETSYLPLYGKDVSTKQSQQGNRIRIPITPTQINTSFERWFRLKVDKLKMEKKLKNFKIYVQSYSPQLGCTLYYKTTDIYDIPKSYNTVNWHTNNGFSLLQDQDYNCNLMIDGSLDGEIQEEGKFTDYGVLIAEITYDQIQQTDFILYVSYDEMDN